MTAVMVMAVARCALLTQALARHRHQVRSGSSGAVAVEGTPQVPMIRGRRIAVCALAACAGALTGVLPATEAASGPSGVKVIATGSDPSTGPVGGAGEGTSVALSADGGTMLVGAPNDHGGFGAAFVFTHDANGMWTEQAKLVASTAIGNARQGTSVSLSSDGNTALIGGPLDAHDSTTASSDGATWVFTRDAMGAWTERQKLVGTNAQGGAAQGQSVALSSDGATALIGGPFDNNSAGAAWVFARDNAGSWTQQQKLVGAGAIGDASQGSSVALSGDGSTALIGGPEDGTAPGAGLATGAAWAFTRDATGAWTEQQKLSDPEAIGNAFQGQSVALSGDGSTALIGGDGDNSGRGAGWVWTRDASGGWTQQDKLIGTGADDAGTSGTRNSGQGHSVSLSSDGGTAVIGGPFDDADTGAVWAFERSAGAWSQLGDKLAGAGAQGAADQGWSVALSGDGQTIASGGPNDDNLTGIGDYLGATWVFPTPAPAPPGGTTTQTTPTATSTPTTTTGPPTTPTTTTGPGSATVPTGPPPTVIPPAAAFVTGGTSAKLPGAAWVSAADSRAGSSPIVAYHWELSTQAAGVAFDTQCGPGAAAMSHPFTIAGTYALKLTVTAADGSQSSVSKTIDVSAASIASQLHDGTVFDCENPAAGDRPSTADCVRSLGWGIVAVGARSGQCFHLEGLIKPTAAPKQNGARDLQPELAGAGSFDYHATITGPVAINGLYIPVPQGVRSDYDTLASTIGGAGLRSVSLRVGKFLTEQLDLRKKIEPVDKAGVKTFHLDEVDTAVGAANDLFGLPVRGAFSIDLVRYASVVRIGVELPSIFALTSDGKRAVAAAYLRLDNATGAYYDGLQLEIPAVYIGPIFVSGLSFKYSKSDDSWSGGAEVRLPPLYGYPLDGRAYGDFGFGLKHGRFDHAGFGLKFEPGLRPQVFPSLFLTHANFALGLHPLRLTGKIGVSEANIVDIDGAVLAAFASTSEPYYIPDDVTPELQPLAGRKLASFTLALGGTAGITVPVLGGSLPLAHAFAIYQAPDYFEFGGGFDYKISFLALSGGVSGFVFPSQGKFNLEGGVKACLQGIEIGYKVVSVKLSLCVKVGAVVSSAGAGFCAVFPVPFPIFGTIPIVVGAGVHWGKSPDLMLFSCDYGKYRETSPKAARDAGATRAVFLPPGLPAAMIRVRGRGATPDVTLTGPDDKPVTASPDALIVKIDDQHTTLIALRHPRAGRWTLSAKPGSAPIGDVASADALAPLRIHARVVRGRGRRRVLRYTLSAVGRAITFIERGPNTNSVLGIARGRSGAITFTPAPGGRGRRSIIALIDEAARPARSLIVARYLAPGIVPAPRRRHRLLTSRYGKRRA